MNQNINELVKLAIAQEDALRATVEQINLADREYLGRGPSKRLLGVLLYGHLSAIRNTLGSANNIHKMPEPSAPTLCGNEVNIPVKLEEGDCVFVQNGVVHRSTLLRVVDALAHYLFGKRDRLESEGGDIGFSGWVTKYCGRFFRHLHYRDI